MTYRLSIITRKEEFGTDTTEDVNQTQYTFMHMDEFHVRIPLYFPLKLYLKQGN